MDMKHIRIQSDIITNGIRVHLGDIPLRIEYPSGIWRKYPKDLKEVLRDNLTLSSTFFVPQILNLESISYASARPLGEVFFFKNGLYDMPVSAHTDGVSSVSYLKRFVNTKTSFEKNIIQIPRYTQDSDFPRQKHMIVPFTFGKESLLTAALAQEVGMNPHLVYVVEPTHTYESKHKISLIDPFFKENGLSVHEIRYDPGSMRYGRLWGKQTELGWGLQTTEYVLLSLPFVHYYNAGYVALGNEQSCREASIDDEGLLTYWTAYDQHPDWTPQQSLLASLILGQNVGAISLVEPLHEIAEMAVLHRRYPKFAKFQTSCLALDKNARSNRWCQNCEKCGSMYAFLQAIGIDPRSIGFTENLFDISHSRLYRKLFFHTQDAHYAVEEEIYLAFYLALKRGVKGSVLDTFKKNILPRFRKKAGGYIREYFGVHKTKNIPVFLEDNILSIYERELSVVRGEIKNLL